MFCFVINVFVSQVGLMFDDEVKWVLVDMVLFVEFLEIELIELVVFGNLVLFVSFDVLCVIGVCFVVDDFGIGYFCL